MPSRSARTRSRGRARRPRRHRLPRETYTDVRSRSPFPPRRRAAATGLPRGDLLGFAKAWAQTSEWKPEAGASLSVLRWKRFVPAEDEAFLKMVDAFTKAMGVKVTVTNESSTTSSPRHRWPPIPAGPDMVWGLFSFPALFPDKCLPLQDVAESLAKKYGPWFPSAEAYGKVKGQWIAIPVASTVATRTTASRR